MTVESRTNIQTCRVVMGWQSVPLAICLLCATVLSGCVPEIRVVTECKGSVTLEDLSITITDNGPPAKIHVHAKLTCDKKPVDGFINVSGFDPRTETVLPIKGKANPPTPTGRVETVNGVIDEDFTIEGFGGNQVRGASIRIDIEGPGGMVKPSTTVVLK